MKLIMFLQQLFSDKIRANDMQLIFKMTRNHLIDKSIQLDFPIKLILSKKKKLSELVVICYLNYFFLP